MKLNFREFSGDDYQSVIDKINEEIDAEDIITIKISETKHHNGYDEFDSWVETTYWFTVFYRI